MSGAAGQGGGLGRIGIFGGTFNPIHVAHLRAAEEVTEALGLERVLFVPSGVPPHKADDPQDTIAPAPLRLAWVRAAVADNPRFDVDPLEAEREGRSYLVDTLEALGERHGRHALVFLLGRDAFAEMGSWRAPRRLLGLAHYAVMTRPPDAAGPLSAWIPEGLAGDLELAPDGRSARHRETGTRVVRVGITALDVSASDVRARLRAGRSVRYLLPESVRRQVEASGVYAADASGASGAAEPRSAESAAGAAAAAGPAGPGEARETGGAGDPRGGRASRT